MRRKTLRITQRETRAVQANEEAEQRDRFDYTENEKAKKQVGVYRDNIRDLEAEVERLQIKEVKLEKLEVETKELQKEVRAAASDNSHFEVEITGLKKELDESHMKAKNFKYSLKRRSIWPRT